MGCTSSSEFKHETAASTTAEKPVNIKKTFSELLDFITHENEYGWLVPKNSKDINWDAMMNYFAYLDPTISKHVVECCDDRRKRNLMNWALSVKGGPPPKLVESILKFSSEVIEQKDEHGRNSLHYGMRFNSSIENIQHLLNTNPSMEKDHYYGQTPLHHGIRWNESISKEMVRLIVESNQEIIEVQDEDGNTPLQIAIKYKRSEVINYLFLEALSEEACSEFVIQKDDGGNTGLHFAVQVGLSLRVIQCILDANPKAVEERNNDGDTPLHFGIKNNKNMSKEVVQVIVEASPKTLLEQNDDGKSPLSSAIEGESSDEVINYMFLEALSEEACSKFSMPEGSDCESGHEFSMQYGLSDSYKIMMEEYHYYLLRME